MNDVVHCGMKSGQEMDDELLHAVFSFHKLTAVMKKSNDSKTNKQTKKEQIQRKITMMLLNSIEVRSHCK